MAWAEDRAPWRHDPSAVPGAKTEGGAARCRPVFPFRDWHEGGKSRQSDQACRPPYLPAPVSPFHAEPLHPLFHPRCRFTDDTVLTVALADSILHGTRYV